MVTAAGLAAVVAGRAVAGCASQPPQGAATAAAMSTAAQAVLGVEVPSAVLLGSASEAAGELGVVASYAVSLAARAG